MRKRERNIKRVDARGRMRENEREREDERERGRERERTREKERERERPGTSGLVQRIRWGPKKLMQARNKWRENKSQMWTSTESSQTIPALDRNPHQREFSPARRRQLFRAEMQLARTLFWNFCFNLSRKTLKWFFTSSGCADLSSATAETKPSHFRWVTFCERGGEWLCWILQRKAAHWERRERRERERGRLWERVARVKWDRGMELREWERTQKGFQGERESES